MCPYENFHNIQEKLRKVFEASLRLNSSYNASVAAESDCMQTIKVTQHRIVSLI